MNPEQWQKVKQIFGEALQLLPEKRALFVAQACGGDGEVLREVKKLLDSFDSQFMQQPVISEVVGQIAGRGQLDIGQTISHYRIEKKIGAGGMGEVYLAYDQKLDRRVAVKILNEKFERQESNLRRFIHEAKAASALNHPNILVILEIGESEDLHYIVSEYIEGKTLREILKEQTLPVAEILDIAIQIANALAAAHEARLIHRDIKPENIMIRPDGYVKILDFGLAKLVERKNVSVLGVEEIAFTQNETAKGVILGTINYMSPEQAKGELVDERTDIFSLGAVVYEMLAGATPFARDSVLETFAHLMIAEPQPLSHFVANVPDQLERIVMRMLKKNNDERYPTMKKALTDLRDLKENLLWEEKLERMAPPNKSTTVILQAATGKTNLPTVQNSYSFVRQITRRKSLAVAMLVVLLAAIGLRVWYFNNSAPRWSNPINMEAINSFGADNYPFLTKDKLTLYFSSDRPGGYGMSDIYVSHRASVDSLWQTPVNLGSTINTERHDFAPNPSPDGRLLFFSSLRSEEGGGGDIYVTRRADPNDYFGWEIPVSVGAPINTAEPEIAPFCLQRPESDTDILFFSRGGLLNQGTDIYYGFVDKEGKAVGTVTLVPELNSDVNDFGMSLSQDGLEIFFGSARPGLGGFADLWTSRRNSISDEWTPPVNVGQPLSTVYTEYTPRLSPDGTTLTFSSDRPGGSVGGQDMWMSTRDNNAGDTSLMVVNLIIALSLILLVLLVYPSLSARQLMKKLSTNYKIT